MSNQPGSPWGSQDPHNSWGTQPQPPAPKPPNPWQRLVDFVRASRLNAILAGLVGLLAVMLLIIAVIIVVPGGNDDKSPVQASSGGSSDDGEKKYGGMSEKDLADALNERLDADKENNKKAFAGLTLMPEGEAFTIERYSVDKWPSGKEHLTLEGATDYQFTNARIIDTEVSPREELGQWEVTGKMFCYDAMIRPHDENQERVSPYKIHYKAILDNERVADRFKRGSQIDRRLGWNGPYRIAGGDVVVDDSDLPEKGAEDYTRCHRIDVDAEDWDKVSDSYTGIMLYFSYTGETDRYMTGDLNWAEDEIGIPVNLK